MCALPESGGAGKRVLLTSLSPRAQDAVYYLYGKTAAASFMHLNDMDIVEDYQIN